MTNPTPHGQVPEALRLADELRKIDEAKKYHPSGPGGQMIGCEQYRLIASGFTFGYLQSAADELRRLHAYCQELESQVIRDCMTHVQNPAEIERIAGDVSKNGAEVNMSTQPVAQTAPAPGERCQHCIDRRDGVYGSWAAPCPYHDDDGKPRPTAKAAPQQEAQEPCPTCAALARTVMLDQTSFDRKPDCYGIRQITDDEGVEEWEDIRTSPDVAREEANDMMATGRGEIYEVVPLWTTPQPAPATQQAGWTNADADAARLALELECLLMDTKDTAVVSKWWQSANEALELHRARLQEAQPSPTAQADSQQAVDALAEAEYFIDNPSAWTHFDQRASDAIAAVCAAFRAARAPAEQQAAPKAAPGEADPADIIAGALQISRGHAIEMMREALEAAPQQEAQEPVAWYEYNADLDAWFLAYSRNPKAKTRPLVFGDTTPQPAPAPLSERDAFEAAWEKLHGKRPVLWSHMFAEHKMETPSHSEGKYFARDEQAAWKLWQARAAIAAQGYTP